MFTNSIKYLKGQRYLLLAFLLLHTIASYYYISHQNITYDEPSYIEYAKRFIHGHPDRILPLDDSKSPIIAVCWVPRMVRQVIQPNYQLNDFGRQDQREGRYMMIVFSLMTALYVYKWCRQFYGNTGWQLPLLLLLFDPLFLAYSTIITTDLACGAFLVALLYHYRQYLVHHSARDFYLTAIFTTLAIVTKQSMLFVLLLLPIIFIVRSWFTPNRSRQKTAVILYKPLIFLLVIVLGINSGYYFHHTGIPLKDLAFESSALRHLQKSLSFAGNIPVPLPESYIQSIDLLQAHKELGAGKPESTFHGVYLFGNVKESGGYWYYYLVLFFYKLPIGTMLLLLASVILFFKNFKRHSFAERNIFLVIPVLFYWCILSFFNDFQIGVRHMLLVFPVLFVGLGYLFKKASAAPLRAKIFVASAVLYTFISVGFYYPDIIPYTNEFISNKKEVYKKVFDSSIDYGQSDDAVASFIASNPGYKRATAVPDTGSFVVLMTEILNHPVGDRPVYPWYQQCTPDSLIRHVILTYNITEAELRDAGLRK